MEGYDNLQDYIKSVNHDLQNKLLFRSAHVVPPSSCPSSQEDENDVDGARPVPPIGSDPSRRRHGHFIYPDRRLRAKTSPSVRDIEELAEDAEAAEKDAMEEEPQEEAVDVEADEEAALRMGLSELQWAFNAVDVRVSNYLITQRAAVRWRVEMVHAQYISKVDLQACVRGEDKKDWRA